MSATAPTPLPTDTPRQLAVRPVGPEAGSYHGPAPAAAPRPAAAPAPAVELLAISAMAMVANDSGPADERIRALALTLRSDSSANVRRIAAWGLNRFADDAEAVDALVAAADHDRDAEVREMAVWALANGSRSSAAATTIARIIRRDTDPHVRATAVWAAGAIRADRGDRRADRCTQERRPRDSARTPPGPSASIGPDAAPAALVSALSDLDQDVRLTTAWALYSIRDAGTVDALDAAFRRETDRDVRNGIVRALVSMGDRSMPALQHLLSSPDTDVRAMAVRRAGRRVRHRAVALAETPTPTVSLTDRR